MLFNLQGLLDLIPWTEIAAVLGGILLFYLKALHSSLKTVKHQVTKNGGNSLSDGIDRIEIKVNELLSINEVLQQISNKPLFRTDGNGGCTWVNVAYSEVTGEGIEELKGVGWLSVVAPEDRSELVGHWAEVVKDGRRFDHTFSIINRNQEQKMKIRCKAYPIILKGEIVGYLGGWIILEKSDLWKHKSIVM